MQCVEMGMRGHCSLMLCYTGSGIREDNVERKRNLETEILNNSFICIYNLIVSNNLVDLYRNT